MAIYKNGQRIAALYKGSTAISRVYKGATLLFDEAEPAPSIGFNLLFLQSQANIQNMTVAVADTGALSPERIVAFVGAHARATTTVTDVLSFVAPSGTATFFQQIGRLTNSRPYAVGAKLDNSPSGDFRINNNVSSSGSGVAMAALALYGCTLDGRVSGVFTTAGPHTFVAPSDGVLVVGAIARTTSRQIISPAPLAGVVPYEDCFLSVGAAVLSSGESFPMQMGSTGTVRLFYVFYPKL